MIKTETTDEWMKRKLDEGDSRRLPVEGRGYGDLVPLVYEKGEIVVRGFSIILDDPRTTKENKDATRQLVRDWLSRNKLPRSSVWIEGKVVKLDYGRQFMAWAKCQVPVTLYVPPFGDEWWEKQGT